MAPASPLKGVSYLHGVIGAGSQILWDDTHCPVFCANSRGNWDYEQVLAWYVNRNAQYDYAIAKGKKVFLISDISLLSAPDAVLRKQLSDLGQKYDIPYKGKWLGQVFIMTNPILRGIVTAVNWLSPNGFAVPTTTASTMAHAVTEMQNAYKKAGEEPPDFPRDYQFPAWEEKK